MILRSLGWSAGIVLLLQLCLTAVHGGEPGVQRGAAVTVRIAYEDTSISETDVLRFRELKRPKVALALSGGGARGIAQIGVLKVLEKYNVPVDFIASTSIGAIIGGLYAAGYTTAELENLVLTTNWEDLLSLLEETKRTDLFVDQKLIGERSFLAIRFLGLEPVIPPAVSSGQRLTDFLSTQILQAPYHAFPDFDHLKIRFRAVATDLVSGKRVVLKDGSLSEALRASATVPLLFNPIEKDSMELVDGGLVDNIPADVARESGCDIVIAVNSTSGLRREDEMAAPWQTADQIVGIMMESRKPEQLKEADVVITPDIERHLSSDFKGLEALIAAGERSAEARIQPLLALMREKAAALEPGDSVFQVRQLAVSSSGVDTTSACWREITGGMNRHVLTMAGIRRQLRNLFNVGTYFDVYAEVAADSEAVRVRYVGVPMPVLGSVRFAGVNLVPEPALQAVFAPLLGRVVNHPLADAAVDSVLRQYRSRGYSLSKIDSAHFDQSTGTLTLRLNEGEIDAIDVQGGVRTEDAFVKREFPLQVGDVFQIDKAKRGLTNINSTRLFEYVYLEVSYVNNRPFLTIRLKERPSQLVRLGARADNERNLQGLIDIRDENFHGIGTELGLLLDGGQRNIDVVLEYKSRRLFDTYLTLGVSGFYRSRNSYVYADAQNQPENHWDRVRVGEYADIRYGGILTFGTQLERLGDATVDLILQNVRIKSLDNAGYLEERYRLSIVRIGTVVDTKDSYPFPAKGVGLRLSYESALQGLGSDIGYNSLSLMYESFASWGQRFTFHPKLTLGFADKTMPLSQQFRLGGQGSFFGLREDDRRGRQLLLLNLELRYFLPFRLVFDTYLRARYDLGTISADPEEIKFTALRHGVGMEVAFRTPLGPAALGVGESFYLSKDLPRNPVQLGPWLFYFMIGYQL
jgi:NTE family protein